MGRKHHAEPRVPQGPDGIAQVGHREYVGGLWHELGDLQFRWLVDRGLEPRHVLFDVGCGSLRAGVRLVPYLEPGHYCGLDKEQDLLEAGVRDELGERLVAIKQPRLVCSRDFEFERFGVHADFAIAQSLFTHITPRLIARCFEKLRPVMAANGVFFATIRESEQEHANPDAAHDWATFMYTRQQMLRMSEPHGWRMHYCGDWHHPRGQRMLMFQPA